MRDALYQLEREGYLQVAFRSGWGVRSFDFKRFDQLYDLRIVLELTAVARLCKSETAADLATLQGVWAAPRDARETNGKRVGDLDAAFHQGLVLATGNYQDVTEKSASSAAWILPVTAASMRPTTNTRNREILHLITQRKDANAASNLRSRIEAAGRGAQDHAAHAVRGTGAGVVGAG